jgi:multidrug resistance efflux pump
MSMSKDSTAAQEPVRLPAGSLGAWFARERGRLVRTAIGVAFLTGTVLLVNRYLIRTISSEASVSPTFVSVAAPIDGYVDHGVESVGTVVPAGATVAVIKNPLVNRGPAAALAARVQSLRGDIEALGSVIASLESLRDGFATRGGVYQRQRLHQLEIMIAEAQTRIEADQAREGASGSHLERVQALRRAGLAPLQAEEDAKRDLTVAEQTLVASHRQLDNLRATMDSLKQGVTIGEFSTSDRSYSSQRVDEVKLRLTQLKGDLAVKKAELAAANEQLAAEEKNLALVSENQVKVAQRSRVWKIQAATGEYVSRGQALFQLIDCTRPHLVAYLNERNYNRVRVGDAVVIRLAGVPTSFAGKVELLLGGPENLLGPEKAISLSPDLRERFGVAISSPELSAAAGPACEAGQNAEVEFMPRGR